MPKMKVNKSAAKRFKISGNGTLMRKQSGKSHKLGKKSTKRKRNLTGFTAMHPSDVSNVKFLLTID